MTRTTRRIVPLLVAAFLLMSPLGLVPSAHAGKYIEKIPATAPDLTAPPDKARICILRTSRLGAAIHVWTFADDRLLGVTRGRTYVVADLEPGTYTIWSKAENVSAKKMSFEAGKTYFIRQVLLPGFGKARARVELFGEEEGRRWAGRIKKTTRLKEKGIEKAREIISKFLEKARGRAERE